MWNRETVTSPEGTPHEQLMRFLRQATVPQDQFYEKLVQAQLDVDLQPVQKPRYYHGEYPENAPFVIDDETKEAYREHDEWLKEAMEHQKVINEQRESQWVDPNQITEPQDYVEPEEVLEVKSEVKIVNQEKKDPKLQELEDGWVDPNAPEL